MTTAFCLSGIAGLALTSAAMPPIGDGSTRYQQRCEISTDALPCVSVTAGTVYRPGYPAASPDANFSSGHCRTDADGSPKQVGVQIAANCAGSLAASTASRLD
jgi:hypothetical protein